NKTRHQPRRVLSRRQHRKEHVGRVVIGRERSLSCYFQNAVAAAERLADIRAMPDVRWCFGQADIKHDMLQARSRMGKLVEPECARASPPRRASAPARRWAARARS